MRQSQNTASYTVSNSLLIVHIILGILAASSALFAKSWGIASFLLGLYYILKNKNRNNEAAIWSAYYMGLEVLLRMTNGFITYEFGKYAVTAFLILGFYVERRNFNSQFKWGLFYLLLMLPALIFTLTDGRFSQLKYLMANLSGPVTLIVSVIYFYKRPFEYQQFKKTLSFYLLAIVSMSITLFIKTPEFDSITFTSDANFDTSGGFGPNQVSTILGAAYAIIFIFYIRKDYFFKYKGIDLAVFFYFLFRALITFSRGGNLAAFIAIGMVILISVFYGFNQIINFRFLSRLIIIAVLVVASALIINSRTEGIFGYRYTGKSTIGKEKEDVTSGRIKILQQEIYIFKQYPLGVGFGGSQYFRNYFFNKNAMSHNEFTRLLSENGVFGAVAILMLLLTPLIRFFKVSKENKIYLTVFIIISFSTMLHSAMRVALPGFFYGFALSVVYYKNANPLNEKSN